MKLICDGAVYQVSCNSDVSIWIEPWASWDARDQWMSLAQANQKRPSPNHKWSPPPDGWLKINTDAAFANGKSTSGIIFKNKNGSLVLAATFAHDCPDATTTECLAILDACNLAKIHNIKKATFLSDCPIAITCINNSPTTSYWTANPVVEKMAFLEHCVYKQIC
ncbi:hypothetical protein CASFOL_042321 [Castilleja foliolosa]|uniref:RNase H type-1 domain-containing protein n=1 Tax=Castilleja foliolosa TaxID=1961234 RepID=A0ABD3BA74_9LAMI